MISGKICGFIVLAAQLHFMSPAQTTKPSTAPCLPRVGNTIDRSACDYFRLFPGIPDFDHAIVTCESPGTTDIRITRNGKQDTTILLDRKLTQQLTWHLDQFEKAQLEWKDGYAETMTKLKQSILDAGIIGPGAATIVEPSSVTLRLQGDRTFKGSILVCRDNYLIVADDFDEAIANRFSSCRVIFKNEIIGLASRGMDTVSSFLPVFRSAAFAGFAVVTTFLGNLSGGGNWGWDFSEKGGLLYAGAAMGLFSGSLAAGTAALLSSPPSVSDTLSLPDEDEIWHRVPIAIPGMLPPELHALLSDAVAQRKSETHAVPATEHRNSEPLAAKQLRPVNGVNETATQFFYAWTYGWNFYRLASRDVGVWVGGELGSENNLLSTSSGRHVLDLNMSFGLGIPFV